MRVTLINKQTTPFIRKNTPKKPLKKLFSSLDQQIIIIKPKVQGGKVKMVEGRCMKCKEQREMKDVAEVVMKNGMKAAKGKCVKCGTNMYKILGKK